MSVAWEQLVRTGHPTGDAQAVQGLAARARSEGLAIQATPVMGGGMHVRAYRAAPNAWAQPQQPGQHVAPISSRFVAPIAAVPRGPQRNVGWAAAPAAGQGWGQSPQAGNAQLVPRAAPAGADWQQRAVQAGPPRPPSFTVQTPLSPAGYLATPQGLSAFRQRSIYAAQGGVPAIIQDLAKLGYLDRELEAKRSRWGWIMGLWIAWVVVLFVISVALPPLFVLWAIFFVSMFFVIRAYGAAKKADLENARYVLALRLLQLLEPDLDPRQPVVLRVGFSPYDDRRKIKSHRKVGVHGGQLDEFVYEDDFLHLAARAADGSKIKLVLYETVRERKGWKRGASGKMKSKRKVQARFAISLGIEVKTGKHGALARMREAAWRAVRLPVLAKAKSLDVGPEGVSLEVVSRAGWQVTTRDARGLPQMLHGAGKVDGLARMPGSTIDAFDCVAMALLSAYQVLNFSAKASKPRAA